MNELKNVMERLSKITGTAPPTDNDVKKVMKVITIKQDIMMHQK